MTERVVTAILCVCLSFAWLKRLLLVALFPALPGWAGLLCGALWVLGTVVAWKFLSGIYLIVLIVSAVVLAWGALQFVRPSNDRPWSTDQAHMPRAAFDDTRVTIENMRHATYRTSEDYDVRWYSRTFDLEALGGADYVVEPFGKTRGPAHVFLTFGFDDGEHVAISIEIRKERGETFSALKGLVRHYEIMYVVGDERDLIGVRANVRRNDVHVYPIRASRDILRALFVSMLERANELVDRPEFYHTLTNTCFMGIAAHVNQLGLKKIPFSYRAVLPGYSDEILFERGGMDFEGTLDDARKRFQINDRSAVREDETGAEWSTRIRRAQR